MATYKHLRSSTANKRPTTSIADGQLAINTNTASPGLFFKDSAGTGIVKVGPVHVGTTAPNATPAAGGSTGNYKGEQWLDISVSPAQMKVWDGSAWVGVVADELPVSKLQDGAARQLLQTDAAGTGVEWTSNVDVPGTLDVTSTATFDGIARHPLGSAAAPTVTFTGDTNTGIYSPGADQVAISTNGTGRLFVDSAGLIKIGTGTTIAPDANADDVVIDAGAADTGLSILSTTTGRIYFGDATDDEAGSIRYVHTDDSMRFETASTERLRITSDGKLGLGTSSPSDVLHVVGDGGDSDNSATSLVESASKAKIRFQSRSGSSLSEFQGTVNGGNTWYSQIANDSGTSSYNQVFNPFGGNVGVGTTSPADTFDCRGDARVQAGNVRFMIRPSGGTSGWLQFSEDGVADRWSVGIANGDSSLIFKTGGGFSGTERCRLDGSGRLLVGTSSARSAFGITSNFQAEGTDYAGGSINLIVNNNSSAGNSAFLNLCRSRGTANGSNTVVQADDSLGAIAWCGADGSDLTSAAASIRAFVDGTPGADDMPGRLVFSTTANGASSPTERMRIQNNGGTFLFQAGDGFRSHTSASAGTTFVLFAGYHSATNNTNGTHVYQVWSNGDVQNTNNSYGALSDIKLKENIVDANSQWDDLKALQVRNYNFKSETNQQTHTQIGLIAQEVELVSPGLVSESPDRDEDGNDLGTVTKSVNYSVLYMKAVKALQEAMERIETLEAKVAALETP